MKEGFFRRRLVRPLLDLLRQGVTPERIALSAALGVVLGVFPALGWTTALCAIAAFSLRLNLPAIQIVNYFMYPAQLALLLPFFRLGEKLFGTKHLPLTVAQILDLIHSGVWNAMGLLWTTTWHAIVVWGLLSPPAAGLLYLVLTPLLRRALRRQVEAAPEAT